MSALRLSLLCLLALPLLLPACAEESAAEESAAEESAAEESAAGAEGAPRRSLTSLHLGSFSSMLAGRMDADGTLDSGAGVLRLRDGEGRPLQLRGLAYGNGPHLWARFTADLGGVDLLGRALGISRTRGGDTRLACMLQLTLTNRSQQERSVGLTGLLSAGGRDPLLRPLPSLAFDAGAQFARDGRLITRDESVVLQWTGKDPEVHVADAVSGPDDPAVTLDWTFSLPPRSTRYLNLALVGPPAGDIVAEDGFRALLAGAPFDDLKEQLDWQSMYRGRFSNFEGGDAQMRLTMIAAVHTLRMLGVANTGVETISEKPYGHPARDMGVKAEALGVFAEWGLGSWASIQIKEMALLASEFGRELSAERRVVLLHGLVRAARLSAENEVPSYLAAAIRELLTEPTIVRPWLDPAEVTADFLDMLTRAEMTGDEASEYSLPELSWAPEPDEPIAALMATMRRELSAGRAHAAWDLYQRVLDSTDIRGIGSMSGAGEIDGLFALGFMALTRAMLVDDRGDDVRMFPHIVAELIPHPGELHLPLIPTRFGLIDTTLFWVGKKKNKLAAQIFDRGMIIPGRVLLTLPEGLRPLALQGVFGGEAEILEDGSIECRPGGKLSRGVRFNVPIRRF